MSARATDKGQYGAFYDFLTAIFAAFTFEANIEHYAKTAIANHKRARMEEKEPFGRPFAS